MKYAIEFLKQKGLDESLVGILTEFIEYQSRRRREDILEEAPEIRERLKSIAARMATERSEIDNAKELLKTYNRWRRGEDLPVPDPVEIGKAINKLTL
jgi:hypothetical protein